MFINKIKYIKIDVYMTPDDKNPVTTVTFNTDYKTSASDLGIKYLSELINQRYYIKMGTSWAEALITCNNEDNYSWAVLKLLDLLLTIEQKQLVYLRKAVKYYKSLQDEGLTILGAWNMVTDFNFKMDISLKNYFMIK